MSGKVIDINPTKRLNKEALDLIRASLNELNADSLEGLMIVYKEKDMAPNLEAYGLTMDMIARAQIILNVIGEEMLAEELMQDIDIELDD
jgi:hypothetical protein